MLGIKRVVQVPPLLRTNPEGQMNLGTETLLKIYRDKYEFLFCFFCLESYSTFLLRYFYRI